MEPPVLSESEPQATDEVSTAASEMERERVFSGIYFHDNRADKMLYKKVYFFENSLADTLHRRNAQHFGGWL